MNTDIISNLNKNGFENIKTYEDIINTAINILDSNDDLFINMVNELDSWNGYADTFRCYPMYELDELHNGMSLSDFLKKITKDFNIHDDYCYYSIYGIESTNDIVSLYRDNCDTGDLFDNIVNYYNHLYIDDSDFQLLIESIINWDSEE